MDTRALIELAKSEGRPLLEPEAMHVLQEYGIPVPAFVVVRSKEDAVGAFERLNCPVVMKILSPDIVHKSDVGGVVVNLTDKGSVERVFDEIVERVAKARPGARIDGVIVYPFIPGGTEVIVGATRDVVFGSVLMFGLGGIFVEVLRDVAFRVAPLTVEDARQMIKELKGYEVLKGLRNRPPSDIEAIVDLLMKVSRLVVENPEISEIDLNPVAVFDRGLIVLDARMLRE